MATPVKLAGPRDVDASQLLPFQRQLISQLIPPPDAHHSTGNMLLILARGLGLRSIVATLLRIYDTPGQLVLLLNATPEEEKGLSEEVGMRLKVVGYEMPQASRVELYKSGGLLSVTSRILVVDMLTKIIPVDLISGVVVLHAETVTPESSEAFIVRIYRQLNKIGFLKAFSDRPESFTYGLSPLQTVLVQLKIREVMIWPRFHEQVSIDLSKRKADVVELYQPLSDKMRDIQAAVIECMEATLSEIKRSNTSLEVEDLTVENALFRSFDVLVRKQLDPVWHRVGPKTKQLVGDLTVLRKLQTYLLAFDSVSFNRFLETIVSAQNTTSTGAARQNQSPWLFTPAADTILKVARARVYVKEAVAEKKDDKGKGKAVDEFAEFRNEDWGPTMEEEEALRAIEEMEESEKRAREGGLEEDEERRRKATKEREEREERERKKRLDERLNWVPPGIVPVLEEQPKWQLLADVLAEIEEDLHWSPVDLHGVSNDTILVMCSSSDTCATLREYLSTMTDEEGGQDMMRSKLSSYFFWKAAMGTMQRNLRGGGVRPQKVELVRSEGGFEGQAVRRKAEWQRGQAPSGKRRRVRGGGAVSVAGGSQGDRKPSTGEGGADADALASEAGDLADIMKTTTADSNAPSFMLPSGPDPDTFSAIDYNDWFGLLSNEDLVIVRPYSDDDDDRVLEELRPKYIVMYDPEPAFVRRVEAYRAAHAGLAVRAYFLMYKDSVEEQRYLSSIRKEKDAFEKLIREKGVMAIPHEAEYRPGEENEQHAALRTVSSRIGGGKQARTDPPRVIVDVREFRSSLPSLLHAGSFLVVPITISIGDYIITPEMCVERKSLPDLIQSFNSGRLFQQCELMTTHYKQPILLIEFDEKKSFNLETYVEERKKGSDQGPASDNDLRSKIVLLTITFPKLRIIWSSSPYQTVDIFRELKENREEPDAGKAVLVGADEVAGGVATEGTGEAGFSTAPQDILRNLPGITTKNYRYVMSKVDNMEALCGLGLKELQELIGVEPGKALHTFIGNDVTDMANMSD